MEATFDALTPEQSREARRLPGWSRGRLAARAGLAAETLTDFERDLRSPRASTVMALRRALASAGVVFRGGTGVELVEEPSAEETIPPGSVGMAS